MAQYTETIVAAVRLRYENTDQTLTSMGAEFGIAARSISRLANERGWAKRIERMRDVPAAAQLLEEAKALAAASLLPVSIRHPEVRAQRASKDDSPDSSSEHGPPPSRLGATRLAPQDDGDGCADAVSKPTPSPIDRLEALLVQQIEAEEIKRSLDAGIRRAKTTDDRRASTLATLTRALHTIHNIRAGRTGEHENAHDTFARHDMPRDINEFRRDLARRINAFVDSRTNGNDADGNPGPRPVDGSR